MSRFDVDIAHRDLKPHNMCFDDVARALAGALRSLRHEVAPGGRRIVLGANDPAKLIDLPVDAVIYNAEQVAVARDSVQLISRIDRVVWDYSALNVAAWRELYVYAICCPVGYHESMEIAEAAPVASQPVDVLFYGWVSERRRAIIDRVKRAGLVVRVLQGAYGVARDRAIARAKVVLNLHHGERAIHEIFRTSHLFANRACVVTEGGGLDDELEDLARRACAYASPDEVAEVCVELCRSDAARREQAERGYLEFKKTNLVDNVRRALEQS